MDPTCTTRGVSLNCGTATSVPPRAVPLVPESSSMVSPWLVALACASSCRISCVRTGAAYGTPRVQVYNWHSWMHTRSPFCFVNGNADSSSSLFTGAACGTHHFKVCLLLSVPCPTQRRYGLAPSAKHRSGTHSTHPQNASGASLRRDARAP